MDALPRRILADQHGGELTVPIRAATHRFHRDLPASRVWAYDGRVPGPTIEVSVSFTHQVGDGLHSAIIKATKPTTSQPNGLTVAAGHPALPLASQAGCC